MDASPYPKSSAQEPAAAGAPAVVRSQELFKGRREILIEHAGSQYRLRITKQDKLILTK